MKTKYLLILMLASTIIGCDSPTKNAAKVKISVKHNPISQVAGCSFDYPLNIIIENKSNKKIINSSFHIAMKLPGYSSDISSDINFYRHYDKVIPPGTKDKSCWRVLFKSITVLQTKQCSAESNSNSPGCLKRCPIRTENDLFAHQECAWNVPACMGYTNVCKPLPFSEWNKANSTPQKYLDHDNDEWALHNAPIIFTKNGDEWFEIEHENLDLIKEKGYFYGDANLEYSIDQQVFEFEK